MEIKSFTPFQPMNVTEKSSLTEFLYRHLGEYGDSKEAISTAIDYAMKDRSAFGGFILLAKEGKYTVGATVVNKTGMEGYVPKHLLVYIATHKEHRGKGIGSRLMKKAIELCKRNLALHVEADNPAKKLYEKMGLKVKYLEMRLEA